MTVVCESHICMKIHLSKTELKRYFVSYDKIEFSNPKVKKTIEALFEIAAEKFLFERSGSLLIELYPSPSGGCVFRFTCSPVPINTADDIYCDMPKRQNLFNNEQYIFLFNDFEDLLSAAENAFSLSDAKKYMSELYSLNKKYFLIIYIPDNDPTRALLLSEFSRLSIKSRTLAGFLEEHAICIAENNAVYKLKKSFFKN